MGGTPTFKRRVGVPPTKAMRSERIVRKRGSFARHGDAGGTPNTVILAYCDMGLTDSGARFGALLADREFKTLLLLDTSLGTSPSAAVGLGVADVLAHLREHRRSYLRGGTPGLSLLVLI